VEVAEDDAPLAAEARSMDGEVFQPDSAEPTAVVPAARAAAAPEAEGAGEFGIAEVAAPVAPAPTSPEEVMGRRPEFNVRRIIHEMKEVEAEVRSILETRDTKRKRKLAGTQRWLELEDDILSWRFSGRFDEDLLRRLHHLVMKRHDLFRQLQFVAGTRPTWNT
jgi:hypothetical protein